MSEQQFDPKNWVTSKEAADMTGYSRDAFPKAAKRGGLDSITVSYTHLTLPTTPYV